MICFPLLDSGGVRRARRAYITSEAVGTRVGATLNRGAYEIVVLGDFGVHTISAFNTTVPCVCWHLSTLGEHPSDVLAPLVAHHHRAARVSPTGVFPSVPPCAYDVVEIDQVALHGLRFCILALLVGCQW